METTQDIIEHPMAAGTHRLVTAGIVPGSLGVGRRDSALVACIMMLLVSAACDQPVQRVAVSGQVLIDGQPLTKGTIRFVPAAGRPATAQISKDGSFRVAEKSLAGSGAEIVGLVPGSYRIAVLATEDLGASEDAEVRWLVPRRYGDFRTSGLETDVQAPTETMIVELTWEGAEEENAETGTEESSISEEDREILEKQKDDA